MNEELLEQLEEAGAEGEAVDVLAAADGEVFHIEMISPWGDKWLWAGVEPEQAQEIYKLLGDPVTFHVHASEEIEEDEEVEQGAE